ncbi:hypothetical protein HHK36_023100 [Tetracentron sinense]|uniref:Meiosis-specific protein ASY3-like coiled-coil domain-containing protein n=1 Tax=Tetracentron sinense TaxID=13715 RepID=A0A834YW38_TETSI|nr:hypothetical protein HHK36_023100 [Tetracentron sinense]
MAAMSSNFSYPFPSSSINVSNYVSMKLSSSNFLLWKMQVMSLLESEDMLGFIDGEFPMPDRVLQLSENKEETPSPKFIAWKKSDRKVKAWVISTLLDEALRLVVGLETARDVWSTLKKTYADDSQAREFQLTQQLQLLKKGDTSLYDYISKFKGICDDLGAIGHPVADKNKVFWLLQGLGPKYESFTTSMMKPPVPTYVDIIPLLQSYEIRTQAHEATIFPNQNIAFVSQQKGRGNNRNRRNNRGNRQPQNSGNQNFQNIGNQNSHNAGNQNFQNSGTRQFDSSGRGFVQAVQNGQRSIQQGQPSQSIDQQQNGTQIGEKCQICGKRNHNALGCWHRFDNSYQLDSIPQALSAVTITDPQDQEWFTDSSVSAHMTGNLGKLTNLRPYTGTDSVEIGDGSQLFISHIGDAKINVQGELTTYSDWLECYDINIDSSTIAIPDPTPDLLGFAVPMADPPTTDITINQSDDEGDKNTGESLNSVRPTSDTCDCSAPPIQQIDQEMLPTIEGPMSTSSLPTEFDNLTITPVGPLRPDITNSLQVVPQPEPHQHHHNTRSKSGVVKPRVLPSLSADIISIPAEPKSIKSAMTHPETLASIIANLAHFANLYFKISSVLQQWSSSMNHAEQVVPAASGIDFLLNQLKMQLWSSIDRNIYKIYLMLCNDTFQDQMSNCRSFGSNYHPCSQSRKISIGVVVDTSTILRSGPTKDDKTALPNSGKLAASVGKLIKDKDEGSGVIASVKGKQTESPKQETSSRISTKSLNQETPATETIQLNANRAFSLQATNGMQKKFNRVKEAPATQTVHFYANRTSIVQPSNGIQKKFNSVTYGRKRGKDGKTERVEEFALVTAQGIRTLDKGETKARTEKTAYRSNEVLRVKLWEILGTNPLPNDRNLDSQNFEVGEKNSKPAGNLHQNGSKIARPRQSADTIETDSESPAGQTIRRPVTRSLTQKKAPTTLQPKLLYEINNGENSPPSSSYRRKRQEKNIFSFAEAERQSESLHETINCGSSMSKRKKSEKKSSRIEPRKICFPEKDNADKIRQATDVDRSKTPPPAEKTSSFCDRMEGFHCIPHQNNRVYLQPNNGMLEEDSHHFPLDGQDDFGSPLPENANQQKDFGSTFLKKNADPHDDFQSPTFAMKAPIRSSSPSPPSPKSNPIENDVHSPTLAERRFSVEGFCRLRDLQTLKPGSFGLDVQIESSDDTRELKESPNVESSYVMEERDTENRLFQSSSVERDAESSVEDFPISKGCRATETWSPEIGSPEKPQFMLRPKSEESDGFQGPSDQNQEDGLGRAVALFALALERLKTKMKSHTRKKNSAILASVAEGIQSQLQNVESHIQTDIGKFTSLDKSKKKCLEMRFLEQQERLKLIHKKFKEEVNQHLQDCRSTVEELEAYRIGLKGTAERQKALHRKLLSQVEEAIETQLGNAERSITAVHKASYLIYIT